MDIFIRWFTKTKVKAIKLPIVPETYSVSGKQQNTSVNIHETGEINLKGKRALVDVSWSSFFPGQSYDFAHASYSDPMATYVNPIEQLLSDNTTVQVIIGTKVNMYATIESFSWSEDQCGDILYDISFKEYRNPGDKSRIDKAVKMNQKIRVAWQEGDTWTKVCKRALGITDPDIVELNRKANQKVIDESIKIYLYFNKKVKTVKESVALAATGQVVTLRYDFS